MKSNYIRNPHKPLFSGWLVLLLAGLFMVSCNEEMDRELTEDYPESGTSRQSGRVMMIVIDGAPGLAVQQAINASMAPTLRSLRSNAMFTFEGLMDSSTALGEEEITVDRAWANLFTGSTTHGVGMNHKSITELDQPTFMELLLRQKPQSRIELFASTPEFYRAFAPDAGSAVSVTNDRELADAVSGYLEVEDQNPADLVIAQLGGVDAAGMEYGFYDDSGNVTPEVLTAISDADSRIGEILASIRQRPDYEQENWMVVLVSSYGGRMEGKFGDDYFEDPRLNTFCMFYHMNFTSKQYLKPLIGETPYTYATPVYSGANATLTAKLQNGKLFNMYVDNREMPYIEDEAEGVYAPDCFTEDGKIKPMEYTIQFMIKDNVSSPSGDYTILTKYPGDHTTVQAPIQSGGGYYFGWASRKMRLMMANSERFNQHPNNNFVSRAWVVMTYIFKYTRKEDGSVDRLVIDSYTNGKIDRAHTSSQNNWGHPAANEDPLTLGYRPGGPTTTTHQYMITNLQFYNVAMDEEYIAENYSKTRLEEYGSSLKYWDNLIGYWPMDRLEDYRDNTLYDYSRYGSKIGGVEGRGSDFVIDGPSVWEYDGTGEILPNIKPQPDQSAFRVVMNLVDVPTQIMQWLGVTPQPDWGLQGISRPPSYNLE